MSEPIQLTRHHLWLYAGVFVLALIAMGVWAEGRGDRAKLAATIEAQKQIIDQAQQQSKALADAQAARDAATQKQLEAMQAAVAAIKTPQQIAQWIPTQLPTTQPITITIPPATQANPKPDATATIPQDALPQLRDFIEGCNECKVKLSTSQQDLAGKQQQLVNAGTELIAVTKERDTAVQAAKGGSFWKRTGRVIKWVGIGIVVGYAASKAHQ